MMPSGLVFTEIILFMQVSGSLIVKNRFKGIIVICSSDRSIGSNSHKRDCYKYLFASIRRIAHNGFIRVLLSLSGMIPRPLGRFEKNPFDTLPQKAG